MHPSSSFLWVGGQAIILFRFCEDDDVHTTKSRTRVIYSQKEVAHFGLDHSWIFSLYNTILAPQ
jgi:hypothetical protein